MADLIGNAALASRLSASASPEYYLNLLALALEETDNIEEAIAIADRMYEQYPFGAPSPDDELLRYLHPKGQG